MEERLNGAQAEAARYLDGPLLIVAGPGSGKTKTLVERVINLFKERAVQPNELFVATFTEKAARELLGRIATRLEEEGLKFNLKEMFVGTFHAICLRLLEQYIDHSPFRKNFVMLDEFTRRYWLFQRLPRFHKIPGIEQLLNMEELEWNQVRALERLFDFMSEERMTPRQLDSMNEIGCFVLARCYELYRALLVEENVIDFPHMQLALYELLQQHPEVVAELTEQLRYLIVDEYQDTNTIQEELLLLLAGERRNICAVGDEDQGIYRFRGATIRNFFRFPQRFSHPPCRIICLQMNYRSTPEIVEFYQQFMAQHDWKSFRLDKPIEAVRPSQRIPVLKVATPRAERRWHEEVYQFLLHLRQSGTITRWNEVAFLFHSVQKNSSVQLLMAYLQERGIAVYAPRSKQFFERDEVQLAIGALLLLFPDLALYHTKMVEWCNRARYYEETVPRFAEWLAQKRQNYRDEQWTGRDSFAKLLYELLQFPFLQQCVTLQIGERKRHQTTRNIAYLIELAIKFESVHVRTTFTAATLPYDLAAFFNVFLYFLVSEGLEEPGVDERLAPQEDALAFYTIHQAKGLEFPVVIVGSLNARPLSSRQQRIIAHLMRATASPVDEPREVEHIHDFYRLYYTAFSRAQDILVLTCEETPRIPSPEFAPLYRALLSWRQHAQSLAQVRVSSVHAMKLRATYSFTSHLSTYASCPRKYKFTELDRFPPLATAETFFGTLLHQTIEDIHKAALRGNDVTIAQARATFDNNYETLAKKQRVQFVPHVRDLAFETIVDYMASHYDAAAIADVELRIVVPYEHYLLTGTVDLVQRRDDQLTIVDFKTSKLQLTDEVKNHYLEQLELYAHLLKEANGADVSTLAIYHLSRREWIPFANTKQRVAQQLTKLEQKIRDIEAQRFTIEQRPTAICQKCELFYFCEGS